MGCDVTSLDLSHLTEEKSSGKYGTASDEHNGDGTGNRIPPSNCKPDVEIFPRKGEDSEVYFRCFNPLRECTKTRDDSQQQSSKRVESENDVGTAIGLTYCPNSKTINELQASFGKLFRIGTIRSTTWTKEIPNDACRLVLPVRETLDDQEAVSIMSNCGKNDVSQQGCNDSLMVVDTFASEQDRRRVASTFSYDLPIDSRDPKKLIYYMKRVAEFGFNHIIIVGEIDYGMIFMDCYGRFFQWENDCQVLWPNESDDGLPWFVFDDGNVY